MPFAILNTHANKSPIKSAPIITINKGTFGMVRFKKLMETAAVFWIAKYAMIRPKRMVTINVAIYHLNRYSCYKI